MTPQPEQPPMDHTPEQETEADATAEPSDGSEQTADLGKESSFWLPKRGDGASYAALASFSSHLGSMVQAGLPLVQALQRLQIHTRKSALRQAAASMQANIQGGCSLSEALSRHPALFDSFYVQAVDLGERSGQLEEVLQRLAALYQWKDDIRKRMLGLLVYPCFLLFCMIVLITVFVGFVLPVVLNAAAASNVAMPLGVQALLIVRNDWFLIALGLFGLSAGLLLFFGRTVLGQRVQQEFMLTVPYVNALVKDIQASNFLFGLHMAYEAGLSMDLAFALATRTIGNAYVREIFEGLIPLIEAGNPLSLVLVDTDVLSGAVLENIVIGEDSGQLGKMLELGLELTMKAINQRIDMLLKLLQPVTVFILALILGSFLLLFFTSIFQFIGAVIGKATGQLHF